MLHQAVGCAASTPQATPEQLLHEAAEQTRVAEALRAASVNGNGQELLPRTPEQLANLLFENALPENDRHEAVEGVLACLATARSNHGSAPLPVRAHLFFRNVQGIWACTNPLCSEVTGRTEPCSVGALYYQPTLSCRCGSRVLNCLLARLVERFSLAVIGAMTRKTRGRIFSAQTILTLKRRQRWRCLTASIGTMPSSGLLTIALR